MKKKIVWLTVTAVALLTASCEKVTGCFYGQDAPVNATVSWTDYNSVEAMIKYFAHHDNTMIQHQDDTIKVYGYAHRYPDRGICLTSGPTKTSSKYVIPICLFLGGPNDYKEGGLYYMTVKIVLSESTSICQSLQLNIFPLEYEER